MKQFKNSKITKTPLAIAIAGMFWHSAVYTQETEQQSTQTPTSVPRPQIQVQEIEEIVTVGRYLSSSQALVAERMDDAFATDLLGSDMIGRLGDSTVAAALRRIPGLTLVDDKFVYIRGLGERYSSTTLNGAQIPSPDLTRNVIPLDIFPTSVVESLRVQKSWSADLPANFAGGGVDIRTKGIPNEFSMGFEVSPGVNSETDSKALTYPGGSDDRWGTDDGTRSFPSALATGLAEYRGNVSASEIQSNSNLSRAEAEVASRQLALSLNRDYRVIEKDTGPDYGLKTYIGNNFILNEDWEAGFLVGASYDTQWRTTTSLSRNRVFPTERTDTERESTESVGLTGTLNFGVKYTGDHSIDTATLFLRNTDDETAISDFFNEDREISDGRGFRDYRFKLEERELVVNQIKGSHYLGDATREILPFLDSVIGWLSTDTNISWFYSESEATTDIPNEVSISSLTNTDPVTTRVLNEAVGLDSSAAEIRFTELEDDVVNYGTNFVVPFEFADSTLEIGGGFNYNRKTRTYRQGQFGLGPINVSDPTFLAGPLNEVFSDANITNPANGFSFSRTGSNNESYIAATVTDAIFGTIDWTLRETWRVALGTRWESYRQVAVDWNPFAYTVINPQVTSDEVILARGVVIEDKFYPSASLTYMTDWWAETFQLRFGFSETSIRPDLRELTGSRYEDPITGEFIRGNPNIVPAESTNFDIRAEWFFANSDSLTATLFYKDIDNPIEIFESPASGTNTAREVHNAESGEVFGVEFEALKELGFLGGLWESFFLQGNLTLQDSELVAGPNPDQPTNPVRELVGASEYVLNLLFGFDSQDGQHTASLIYNVFGERLYVAGRNGEPDGFEQPFNSVDLTYSWYPTDSLTFKLKAQNLLGEKIEIERAGVTTFEEDPGTSYSASLSWSW